MPRIAPFSGKRPDRYKETRTLTDPEAGLEDAITLQYLDKPLAHLAVDVASKLVMQYVGFPDEGVLPKDEFTYLDGVPVEMSEALCRSVGNIYVMQCPRVDGAPVYSTDELIALSVTQEGFWNALEKFANEVNQKGAQTKNALRVSAGSGSPTPSGGSSLTPNSPPEPTASSAA